METAIILGIQLATKLIGVAEEKFKSGQISKEDQMKVRAEYEAFMAKVETLETQPGWLIEPDPV